MNGFTPYVVTVSAFDLRNQAPYLPPRINRAARAAYRLEYVAQLAAQEAREASARALHGLGEREVEVSLRWYLGARSPWLRYFSEEGPQP